MDNTDPKPIEVRMLEAIIATLNEVNNSLAQKYEIERRSRGSWVMRSVGVRDAMEIVQAMKANAMRAIVKAAQRHLEGECINCGAASQVPCSDTCGGRRIALPSGLTVLSAEEVAARGFEAEGGEEVEVVEPALN
jgi:hypothetical protein